MRIIVNDIAASKGGAMTVLKQFYDYIRENDTQNEWIFMLGEKYLEETQNIKVECFPQIKSSRIKKLLFDCFFGKRIVNKFNPDIILSLQNIIVFGAKVPQMVYIHQSIPFQDVKKFSFLKGDERPLAIVQHLIGFLIKLSAKKANKVFVQTEWMREAVATKVGIAREKIITTFPEIELFELDKNKFDSKRFFYPTGNLTYKNINSIVKACDILNARGMDDFEVRLTLSEGTVKHKNIKCIDYIGRERLQLEYQSATLVFPSYIETIGLPLLEARSCETIVLASDMPFSREGIEDYENGYFFNPFKPEELAKLMEKVICGEIQRRTDTVKLPGKQNGWAKLVEEVIRF